MPACACRHACERAQLHVCLCACVFVCEMCACAHEGISVCELISMRACWPTHAGLHTHTYL